MEIPAWVPTVLQYFIVGNGVIVDLPRTDRQRTATTESNERKVDVLIIEVQMKVRHIIAQPDIGHNSVQGMIRLWDTGKWVVVAIPDC